MPTDRKKRMLRLTLAVTVVAAVALCVVWQQQGERPSREQAIGQARMVSKSTDRDAARSTRSIPGRPGEVSLCQALGPAAPFPIWAVDSTAACGTAEVGWASRGYIPWQSFAQGEYIGHARTAHVPAYRLRVDDQLAIFYLRTREVQSRAYELQVGDQILVESLTAGGSTVSTTPGGASDGNTDEESINRELAVQPDGTITMPLIGRVTAAGRTLEALQAELEERFKEFYRVPAITVTPLLVNTKLEDLLATVDARGGIAGGLQVSVVVTPAGKIQLPALGSVYVQGLTLAEAKMEIDSRYAATIPGVSVTVDLTERAERFVYVLGEVETPGQFVLEGPTTTMQAIALAGGWNIGANLRQVVVFRRGPDWRLMATMVDLRGALYARRPAPADEIWLNDSDIVLVPKSPIQQFDEAIELFLSRGLYSAIPVERIWGQGFNTVTSLQGN
ncbi:MAG: polysaccharide biosynthesis/export family protein [Planctomycetota bacterium]